MQVESLAAVVAVVWFLPNTAGFGFGFSLPSPLPPSDSFPFASPCWHLHIPAPGRPGSVTPLHPRACRSWGTSWEGRTLPSVPVRGFREESQHGELFLLQRTGSSWCWLPAASAPEAELSACRAHPLPPPSSPGQPGSRFLIMWSALDAKIKRKNELCALL